MTTEEKAKAYDEALEIAKKNYDVAQDLCNGSQIGVECFKNTLTNIFPELAESEDEKIRKGLIKGLSAMRDIHHHQTFSDDVININEALAWLEKQGKQKVSVADFKAKDWYVSKVDGKIRNIYYSVDKVEPKFKVKYAGSEYNVLEVKDIAGVTFYGIEDEPNHIDYVKAENCDSGYAIKENCSPYPTKPAVFSEKKPTAWSDEDDYNLQCMIAKVTYDIQKGNVGRNNELIDWLKSLKERVQPQPKQEWSGEDDAYKELAICAVANFYDEENPLNKCIVNWLKSLKDKIKEN